MHLLPQYCGLECQKAHWQIHKIICKSYLGKLNWRPARERECREPAWTTASAARNWHNPFGGGKYLWGNTPAIDILQMRNNEGSSYEKDIALLFADQS